MTVDRVAASLPRAQGIDAAVRRFATQGAFAYPIITQEFRVDAPQLMPKGLVGVSLDLGSLPAPATAVRVVAEVRGARASLSLELRRLGEVREPESGRRLVQYSARGPQHPAFADLREVAFRVELAGRVLATHSVPGSIAERVPSGRIAFGG